MNTLGTQQTLKIILLLSLSSLWYYCGYSCPEKCIWYCQHRYSSQFSYHIQPSITLANGIKVDTSGQNIDIHLLEKKTTAIVECVQDLFAQQNFDISAEQKTSMFCAHNSLLEKPLLECLVIKIPSDFLISMDGKTQLLPYLAPPELCVAKDLIPTKEFPCRWRAGIQDNLVVVTTPDLTNFSEHFIRLLTGCNYIYASPKLSVCATL